MPEAKLGKLNGRWVVSWWENGKRRRHRLDADTQGEAQRAALDKIRKETAGPVNEQTVAKLWALYRAEKDGRRVAVAMGHEWKAVGPHFGHLRPEHVTAEVCRAYTDLRREQGKHDGTIWTELGHLRTVFRWAHDGGLIPRAPKVERPPKPAPKDRWLTEPEIDRLLAVDCAFHVKLAIHLMLSTAGRVGAILDLKWERVDFERGQVNLRVDGTGPRKGRAVVPMNAGLRGVLSQARQIAATEFVVEWNNAQVQSIKTGFKAAVTAAGLTGVTPHALRHTAAVHLAAAGVSMERISQYLGHSNTSVTERVYARFAPEHLREEADILDFTKIRARKG